MLKRKMRIIGLKLISFTKGIGFLGVNAFLRYSNVSKFLTSGVCLDAGSGRRSKLPLYRQDVEFISLDLEPGFGCHVIGDIRFLPFVDKCFDTVVAIDVLEHLPEKSRDIALMELIRVATKKVIIHMPLQDGISFRGKEYDALFSRMYTKLHGKPCATTEEHLSYQYSRPVDLEKYDFKLVGDQNVNCWIIIAILEELLYPFGNIISWALYLLFLKWIKKSHLIGGLLL